MGFNFISKQTKVILKRYLVMSLAIGLVLLCCLFLKTVSHYLQKQGLLQVYKPVTTKDSLDFGMRYQNIS